MNDFIFVWVNGSLFNNQQSSSWDYPKNPWIYLLPSLVLIIAYMATVRKMRYKNLEYIRKKYPDPNQILKDPAAAVEVLAITAQKEFPFSFHFSLQLAMFKTYTTPKTSKILVSTGEFGNQCSRRYEDTDIILRELADIHGRIENHIQEYPDTPKDHIDSQWERRDKAINRLNELHGRYKIENDDFLYTLTMFITEPVAWINRYDWRELDEREINACYRAWYDIGLGMKIKNIPDSFERILKFKEEHAKKHVYYGKANWKCGEPTLRLFISCIPFSNQLYNLACHVLPSVLTPGDAEAFGLPKENKIYSHLIYLLLNVRAFFVRYFMLPRKSFMIRTPFYPSSNGMFVPNFFVYNNKVYKEGYDISNVGPEKYAKRKVPGCPFA
ncbi:unnamed protein product [Rhizopus stolonifer]